MRRSQLGSSTAASKTPLVRGDLPTGTVTFFFTDVEGSTKLLEEIGDRSYDQALAEHRRIVRAACAAQGGENLDGRTVMRARDRRGMTEGRLLA